MESSVRGQMAELDFPRYVGMTAGAAVRVRRKHPLIRYSNLLSGCQNNRSVSFLTGIGSRRRPPAQVVAARKYFLFAPSYPRLSPLETVC
jgi:hypothetical protein